VDLIGWLYLAGWCDGVMVRYDVKVGDWLVIFTSMVRYDVKVDQGGSKSGDHVGRMSTVIGGLK